MRRRSFLGGLAGLVGGVVLAGRLPIPPLEPLQPEDLVDPVVLRPPPRVVEPAWTLEPEADVCRRHGCRVESRYDVRMLADQVVHVDPTRERYAAFQIESVHSVNVDPRLRALYLDKLTYAAHRPDDKVGNPLDRPVTADDLIRVWQRGAEAGWFEEPEPVRLVVPPAMLPGIYRLDQTVFHDYSRALTDRIDLYGYRDASAPGAELFGLPIVVSSFHKGDLVTLVHPDGRMLDVNLLGRHPCLLNGEAFDRMAVAA